MMVMCVMILSPGNELSIEENLFYGFDKRSKTLISIAKRNKKEVQK